MISEELKKSILIEAFKGHLSNRLDTDSNVNSLLTVVKQEKQDLLKSGKISKIDVFKKITEKEIPFSIPKEWKWVRWGELSNSIQYGVNAGAKNYGKIKLVRISDIKDNKILWETVPYCDIKESTLPQYLLNENDILFARTGGTVGKSVVVKNMPTDEPYVFAGYLIRSNYCKKINYKFLKYFMESPLYWSQLKKGTNGSAQPNCNGQTLSNMILPLPPLEEQQRIVNKIEELFEKLDEIKPIEEELNLLKSNFSSEIKKAILNKVLDKYKDNMVNLEKVSNINGGYAFKSSEYVKEGIRVIRISDFDETGIKEENPVRYKYKSDLEQYKLYNGNIIICMTGGTVGKNILLKNIPNNYYANQRVATIKVNDNFLPEFIYYCINTPYIQKIIQNNKNSTNDNISIGLIKSFPIPNISLKEQHSIVDKLEQLLPLCYDIDKIVNQ